MAREACEELLVRNSLGRMAVSFQDRVDIQPLNYVYQDRWIFGRTSESATLSALRHNRWVAFQVDEVQDAWNWVSVVVRGGIHLLGEGGGEKDQRLYQEASDALRELMPNGAEESDLAPYRAVLFGLAPHEISGRSARVVSPDDSGPSAVGTSAPLGHS